MKVPVVRKAIEGACGVYTPDDYSVLQLMAEVGETDAENPVAVGAYAFFQLYTGSIGFWTYEGNSPFMGLQNLPPLREFTAAFGWQEFAAELDRIQNSLRDFSEDQLSKYAKFELESETHTSLDRITFSEVLTDLVVSDFERNDRAMFKRACEFLENNVEFLEFDDGASLKAWRQSQS